MLVLPWLLSATVQPSMLVFIIVYGLDWVATVPPTAAICRETFGADGSVVFGWVFAAHQLGAAAAALGAGAIRDATGADVRSLPITRDEMLDALARAREQKKERVGATPA